MRLPVSHLFSAFAGTVCALALAGCALSPTAAPSPESGQAIHGIAHGGQQPIANGHVYLFAAGTSGYGGASTSLLDSAKTLHSDTVGAYVLTGSDGSFTITSDYMCTQNTQVYIYILGGDTGGGPNTASGLMAILGNCPSGGSLATTYPTVAVNEVSTVAAAYAFAGFATDATDVSSSGTALAQTGIANAFANAANLVDLRSGLALATTPPPASNGTVPQEEINTLADILSACVNSADVTLTTHSASCVSLFGETLSGGTTGSAPGDTATAAINIAHNPGANVATLYGNPTPTTPFSPSLPNQPNDFTIAVTYTGGGLYHPALVAIDASGSAWITSPAYPDGVLSKFSNLGAPISTSSGFTDGNSVELGVAIDPSGDVWVASSAGVSEFSITGSPTTVSDNGGISGQQGIAIDGSGDVWIANEGDSGVFGQTGSISEIDNSGEAISPSTGYAGASIYLPNMIAIDHSGNAWAVQYGTSTLVKVSSAGSISGGFGSGTLTQPSSVAIDSAGSPWVANAYGSVTKFSTSGSVVNTYSGGGITATADIAIDGTGNVWVSNQFNSIGELSKLGAGLAPSSGYTSSGLNSPYGIAVDGSGDVWVVDNGASSVTEFIGAASPVVTPLAIGEKNNTLGTRP